MIPKGFTPEEWAIVERFAKSQQQDNDMLTDTDTNGFIVTVDTYYKMGLMIENLVSFCHGAAKANNWWDKERNVGELLCLIHSEISEAMEGHRKDAKDQHLTEQASMTVELADALIRIFDLAGGLRLNLGTCFAEKFCYNQMRADHKIENRMAPEGKKY
jgi:NTP pyrophosphatase (non-canonical NTP hydrolase)